jgi:hypothetical protein
MARQKQCGTRRGPRRLHRHVDRAPSEGYGWGCKSAGWIGRRKRASGQNIQGTEAHSGKLEKREMTTFDDREKSFEKRFALDEELKFKSEQRRNRLLGEWAAGKLGLTGAAVDEYVRALRRADLATKGDDDVFQKIRKDFDEKSIAVPDTELRRAMSDFLAAAVGQIEGERKG